MNKLVLAALPGLSARRWQWIHLTGANDFELVKAAYAQAGLRAVVRPFLAEMDLALGAATAAISRAGASSLAEMAALQLPTILVPLPTAADNHQYFNARLLVASGAARLLDQKTGTPAEVATSLTSVMEDEAVRNQLRTALALWHAPKSAAEIAASILRQSTRSLPLPATPAAAKVLTT